MTKEILECERCGSVQLAPDEGLWNCLACGAPLPMPEERYAERTQLICASSDPISVVAGWDCFTTDSIINTTTTGNTYTIRFPEK